MAITGTQQPASPAIQLQSNGNKVYTRVFKYARDYAWEAEMPTVGSLHATYGYYRGHQSSNGPQYVTVTLTYDSEGSTTNFNPADGDSEYWAQTVGEEKPIEYHPDYLTNWNHGLYAVQSLKVAGAIPTKANMPNAAWATATTKNDMKGQVKWRWFKADPGIEWREIEAPTKGYDFYIAPTRAVVERAYHRTQSAAEAALATVGTLVNPAETFGATPSHTAPFTVANPGNWLVNSSDTEYDGKYWVATTEYWHSDGKNNRIDSSTGAATADPTVLGWDMEVYS